MLLQKIKTHISRFDRLCSRRTEPIIVVSGLPRSGTSMMMKILESAGIPLLTDGFRVADEDNPKGYYEYERVKNLAEGDTAWLHEAHGRAVKIISALLPYLPLDYMYRIIFMQRKISEILASQRKMLINRASDPNSVSDTEITASYQRHLKKIEMWLKSTSNVQYIVIDYNLLLSAPESHLMQLNGFFGGTLDMKSMIEGIDPILYRNRD
jgi:hypothetical protein